MSSDYEGMSGPEKQVADFLSNNNLWWKYEYPVFVYDKKDRPRVWAPDFHLPKFGIFIEVCGSEEVDYSYREAIYEKNYLKVIFIHFYKSDKWKQFLMERIIHIQNSRKQQLEYIVKFSKVPVNLEIM
jgi:hypothetical protein